MNEENEKKINNLEEEKIVLNDEIVKSPPTAALAAKNQC